MRTQSVSIKQNKQNRRAAGKIESDYDDGLLRVEHRNYFISWRGEVIKLNRVDFRIISILTKNAGGFVPFEQVWSHIFDDARPFNLKSLKVYVCNLRRRFSSYGIEFAVKRGLGYQLVSPGKSIKTDQ